MKWNKAEINFVEAARVARLATADAKGIPHNVPICPLFDGGTLYFATEAKAKKVRNIRTNPNVALVLDDYTEAWDHLRGILIQGRARVVESRKFRSLRKRFYAKYLQYPSKAPLTVGDTAIVEIIPEKNSAGDFEAAPGLACLAFKKVSAIVRARFCQRRGDMATLLNCSATTPCIRGPR